MNWNTVFRLRQFARGSLWVLPLVGGLLGVLLGVVVQLADRSVHLPSYWTYSASTASTVLSAIVGSDGGADRVRGDRYVLVVQMATGMLSSRYMRLWYRDRVLKMLLALVVGTLTFSFALLRRVESNFVPNLGVTIAGVLVVISLLLFVIFLDRFLHRLRPVAVAMLVARSARRSFEGYTTALAAAPEVFSAVFEAGGEQPALVVRSAGPGAIQALDVRGLAGCARARVSRGDLSSGRRLRAGRRRTDRDLRRHGVRRPSAEQAAQNDRPGRRAHDQQDPAFAIRIIVDIANKALSAAVNDPTTAVQALDRLSEVLRRIGTTDLPRPRWRASDARHAGVVIPARRWEDYLTLGVTEIREYGCGAIQVMRRMRAMLEELRDEVLAEHRAAVEEELGRLDMTVRRAFADSVDSDRANTADRQGIGGPTEPPSHSTMTR